LPPPPRRGAKKVSAGSQHLIQSTARSRFKIITGLNAA
jgi:hypothetical protein